MMYKLLLSFFLVFFSPWGFAGQPPVIPVQATNCVVGSFTNTGNNYWKTISLKITNQCGQTVDIQNTTITFNNAKAISTSFWGNFSPLSYPDNNLQITSQLQAAGNYLTSLYLHFPTYQGANSKLLNGQSFTIVYGAPSADYVTGTVNVYLGTSVNTSSIELKNVTAQPANTTQSYGLVRLLFNNQPLSEVQIPWMNSVKVNNLVAGTYTISPVSFNDNNGNNYQGSANPATIALTSGATVSSSVSYTIVPASGNIAFKVQSLPTEMAGYTGKPVVSLNATNGSTTNATVNWNATTTVSNLVTGSAYNFTTPTITFNGYNCAGTFNPFSAVAATTAPIVNLTYSCTPVPLDNVTVNVNGAPTTTSSITATFTPNNGTTPVTQAINLVNGQGSAIVRLTDRAIYTVSSTNINGYSAAYNPQPLTALPNGVETITYSPVAPATGGRIIGFMAGWKTPPTATELVNAGYTHVMVAFGVFSTSTPGQITPAFETISASYIKSLQNAGIKVLLSLGGALTNLPNTTVDFHEVLAKASSPTAFTSTFIQSLESLMTQYGFDGFDIDVEFGINAGGTFSNPQGDIAVLANILNTMHAKHPNLLLTLTPQTANIAVTTNFDATWGNYSSLIMQTYNSLAWVGIQNYNTGCMLGIDSVCHDPNATSSPNFSVAMATDLLENWPAGYQPYKGFLKPSQVVIGYLAPNAQGTGDGRPVIPVSTIKRAIQCLRTAVKGTNSCDTYVPPRAYPGIGGAFNWEISFDQNNNYQWAKGLKACVVNGTC